MTLVTVKAFWDHNNFIWILRLSQNDILVYFDGAYALRFYCILRDRWKILRGRFSPLKTPLKNIACISLSREGRHLRGVWHYTAFLTKFYTVRLLLLPKLLTKQNSKSSREWKNFRSFWPSKTLNTGLRPVCCLCRHASNDRKEYVNVDF